MMSDYTWGKGSRYTDGYGYSPPQPVENKNKTNSELVASYEAAQRRAAELEDMLHEKQKEVTRLRDLLKSRGWTKNK